MTVLILVRFDSAALAPVAVRHAAVLTLAGRNMGITDRDGETKTVGEIGYKTEDKRLGLCEITDRAFPSV